MNICRMAKRNRREKTSIVALNYCERGGIVNSATNIPKDICTKVNLRKTICFNWYYSLTFLISVLIKKNYHT